MTENRHHVSTRMWRRWTETARATFNHTYETLFEQGLYVHPRTEPLPLQEWDTIRWNAAFEAAEFITKREKGQI